MSDRLIIRGAREHNLKNVSLDLPRDKLIVFTGLSGSGKSSLAFELRAVVGAVLDTDAGEQQTEIVVDLGDRADGGPRVA